MIIKIITENSDFFKSIARRITELTYGIEIMQIREFAEDFNIAEDKADAFRDKSIILTEDFCKENLPVTRLIAEIEEKYGFMRRKNFVDTKNNAQVWFVRSEWGGSGCSSIALTLARILAAKNDGKVAFISASDVMKNLCYYEPLNPAQRPPGELAYLLKTEGHVSIFRYLTEDRYGVFTVTADNCLEQLIAKLTAEETFSYIIADIGSIGTDISCHGFINVASGTDCRAEAFLKAAEEDVKGGSKEFYVVNKGRYFKSEIGLFYIPDEQESFISKGKTVEITMDGGFAAAVEPIASALMNYERDYER